MSQIITSILGLDIGSKRIGIAKSLWPDGIANPYITLKNDAEFLDQLKKIIDDESIKFIVTGYPRGLSSQITKQTDYVKSFIAQLQTHLNLPIYVVDEALTSIKAEQELKQRKGVVYTKEDIDSLSATYILEDFILEHPGGKGV